MASRRGLPSGWRRASASIAIIDAGMSSLGNFGLVWVGAQILSIEEFGQLSAAMTIGLILQGLSKALFVDAYTLGYSAEAVDLQRRRSSTVLATSLTGGLALSAIFAGIAQLLSPLAGYVVAIAWATVPLVAQDTVRWICYTRRDRVTALLCTTAWTLGTGVGLVILWRNELFSAESAILVWGAAAGVAAVATLVRLQLRPGFGGVRDWIRECRGVGARSAIDYGLTQAVGIGGALLVAGFAGVVQYGLFRVAQLPLAAIQIAITGSIAVLQPEMVRRVAKGHRDRALHLARQVATALAALSILVAGLAVALPDDLGVTLFGESWLDARAIVPILAIGMMASGVGAAYGPYLRATGRLDFEVRTKLVVSPFAVFAITAGSILLGGAGGAAGQSIATLIIAICFVSAARAKGKFGRTG